MCLSHSRPNGDRPSILPSVRYHLHDNPSSQPLFQHVSLQMNVLNSNQFGIGTTRFFSPPGLLSLSG